MQNLIICKLSFLFTFVVASKISSKKTQNQCSMPRVHSETKDRKVQIGDTINLRLYGKAFLSCFLGHCGKLVSFHKRSGDASRGLNIEDAISRGSSGGESKAYIFVRLFEFIHHIDLRQRLQTQVSLNILVISSNEKLYARVRKNACNFNVRKRGTTTREGTRTVGEVAMLTSPEWTKQLYIAG